VTRLAAGNRELLRETVSSTAHVQLLKEQGRTRTRTGRTPLLSITALATPLARLPALRDARHPNLSPLLFQALVSDTV
jgi:hypothetical protein